VAITNLQQARQMFRYGGDTMGGPNDKSSNQGPAGGASSGGNYGGGRPTMADVAGPVTGGGRPTMADVAGPVTGPVNMSSFGDTGDIVQADFTPYNQRPDTITSFFDNYKANVRSNPFNLGAIGAMKTLAQTAQARGLLGFRPTVGPAFTGGGGGDNGIMNLYTPNMFNVDQDETIEDIDGDGIISLQDIVLRFQGADKTLNPQAVGLQDTDQLRAMIQERVKNLYT
jgi:hypothetical protein